MKDKKSLYLIVTGIGLITTIAVAVFSTSNTSLFKSLAGGIVHTSDKGRTLTLDSTTPLEIDGTTGSLVVGNVGVYANNCEALDNGVITMNGGSLALYCSTAGLNASDRYYGFNGSDISAIIIVLNNRNTKFTLNTRWARVDSTLKISSYSSGTSKEIEASSENQTIELTTSNSIIGTKVDTYPCICFYSSKSDALDIISLTVQYTCNS